MNVEVNIWGVLGAFIASMVVGSIWYAKPIFGKEWAKMVGLDDKKMGEGAGAAFTKMIPMALLEAYALAYVTYIFKYFFQSYTWMTASLVTALWMWAGFQLTSFVVHDAFEQRPLKLTLINIGNQLATLLAMGLVIGLLKP